MYNEQARDEGKEVTRTNWSKENLHLFCDLCIQYAERSKGKRGATISQSMQWKENIRSSPIHSPQSNEHEIFGRRGSKRTNESDVLGSHTSAKVDFNRKIGGAVLLTVKLDIMVEAITQRNKRDMELMKLEVLGDYSHSLVDSLAKLMSMPNLILDSPEFCFAFTLIEDPQKRTILHGIPDDTSRLQWIKYLFDKQ
ncbi:hypothetical protein V6N13_133815 [Hibiscus sabdariffa]|uniref:Uncharacterized protein n=1 Tax=Hibiscus sabdariffa TaxID=183260 RepID=A0ABR2R088_9ROSI